MMEMNKSMTDVMWILVSAGLVLLMQAGFLCLEAGLTRTKNSINVAIKNLTDFGVSVLLFWLFGFGLMFGASWNGIVGLSHFGANLQQNHPWFASFFIFQLMFCGTAVTIISGAIAERTKFVGYLLTASVVSGFVYPLFGHWVWGGVYSGIDGWLAKLGFVDFAGSTVVHSVGGWAALSMVLIIGPRTGLFEKEGSPKKIPASNLPVAMMGVLLLWFGWIGFNGGSTLSMDKQVPLIIANTVLAAGAGMLVALSLGWRIYGYPSPNFVINGSLSGLVAITAGCHAVSAPSALAIGGLGAVVMLATSELLIRLRIDDAVGAIPVHLAAGIWGTLAVAIFGDLEAIGTGLTRTEQILVQGTGIMACFCYAFGVSYLVLILINRIYPLRISTEEERLGLNVIEHRASTETYELCQFMEEQSRSQNLSLRAPVEPFTEVGQIAKQYNRVVEGFEISQEKIRNLSHAIEQSANVVIITDREGKIDYVNPKFSEITGYSPREVMGKNPRILKSGKTSVDEYRDLWKTITSGQAWKGEFQNRKKNGQFYWASATISPVRNSQGEITHFIGIQEDITEQKRIHDELEKTRDQALTAFKAKSEFLATMSHEIRTPMNAVIGMAELLSETTLQDEQKEYVTTLKRNGENLLKLINDILDFSKIEAGRLELEKVPFNVYEMIEGVTELNAVRAHQKGLELVHVISQKVPRELMGDSSRLHQVFVNLVGNAIKFTEKGEIVLTVEVTSSRNKPQIDKDERELLFSVRDTGIGISENKIDAIFDNFTQADSSTTRKHGGTGLGLAISKKIVECMKGTIWAESEVGKGTTFYVSLPMEIPEQTQNVEDSRLTFEHVEPHNILIVDDNDTNRFVLREMLKSYNFQITEAADGQEGLRALKEASEHGDYFDLILLDCRMPVMDGFEFSEKVKQGHGKREVTIIMLTSDDRTDGVRRAREIGLEGYLIKPIKKRELLNAIEKNIQNNSRNAVRQTKETGTPAKNQPEFKPQNLLDTDNQRIHSKSMTRCVQKRILLIEDQPDNRLVVASYLKREPYILEIAEDGRKGFEKFKSKPYDLILMDIHMPVMDGYEATQAIRTWERTQNGHGHPNAPVPIIAISASVLKEDIQRSIEVGCNRHLMKPLKKAELLQAIYEFEKNGGDRP